MYSINNSVRLLGNVGMEPQVLTFDNGNKVAKISLATSEKRKNATGEVQELTTWHNLVVWGKGADVLQTYLKKGDKIAIEGKLTNREYEDKTGNKRYVTEVVVNDFTLLGGNKAASKEKSTSRKKEADLPF